MKVLLATEKPFAAQAVQEIRKIIVDAGLVFVALEKYTGKAPLLEAVRDVEAVIIRSDIIDEEVMAAAPKLRLIVRAGAGYDNVDLEAATRRNIVVMNTPGQNANAVAELVFGLLLYVQRNQLDGTTGSELKNKRLGLYAFGNVAKMVAKIARGFSMPIYAYSPILTHDDLRKEGEYGVISVYSAEELFETSDIVSLHMPLMEETVKVVNYGLLSRLPDNGVIVNTARKEVVDEEDMIRIMTERPKFKYITDVKADMHDEFLAKFPGRYFATPKKAGAQTAEANVNAGLAAARQVAGYLLNGDDRCRVN